MKLTPEVRAIVRDLRNTDPLLAGFTEEQVAEMSRLAIYLAIAKSDDPELLIQRLVGLNYLKNISINPSAPAADSISDDSGRSPV